MQSSFVHLRLHTEYSLVDGLVRIKPLMHDVGTKGMNAVAVTDFCNLFAAVKVYQSALSSGIKPILGCELLCQEKDKPDSVFSILFLCQTLDGYRNLTRLVSKAYLEGQHQGQPRIQHEWINSHAEGLIALSGARFGDVGQAILAGDMEKAEVLALSWMNLFPNRFYLEIQRTERADEAIYNEKIVQLADLLQLPLVATNDVCFLNEDDFEAHEARVCIHDGYALSDPRRSHRYSAKQYLRSADEMVTLFSDIPQAVQNSVEISKRCNVQLELGKNYLPNFLLPEGTSVEAHLCQLAMSGLDLRLQKLFRTRKNELAECRKVYDDRLQVELNVINSMGFASYFLIVADFIKWAKGNGIPVGPGRGSGAGSLVAYVLEITDLDPLDFDLLFERFLNPERVSMPDFDIDFCMEGRDRVIDYVAEKYGRHSVSQIITFGSMAAKAVIRDVGRVFGQPYGFVDKLAKLIPFEIGMTLTKALEMQEELRRRYEEEDDVKDLIDLAIKLEGLTRNAGKHAGGVVIAPSQLTDFTAIYCEEGSTQIVSQFDKDDVEAVGLVKFDFLGLRTLTIIDKALKTVNGQQKVAGLPLIDISEIPMDDAKTFELLKACQTTAVFQLESRGMKELIHRLRPDCFEEIIALVALFRPGPLQSGMVDDFIDRKHGRAKVEYPHPDLEPVLKPTYGVILYQEQVMQIAQVLANFTLGAADLLRRAMGKKKPEEMAQQREIFTSGAIERGVDGQIATAIFDLMEKFAGYGFNKSHSAAYALVAYQTAWLKTHHPAAFMAAVMSADMDNTDKVVNFIQECKAMNIEVLPPLINHSHHGFTVRDSNAIIYGLGAVKGIGESAIQNIVEQRVLEGPFDGLFSLCQRMDLRKTNRRVLEALIKCGAMDEWQVERSILFASLDNAIQAGARFNQSKSNGQSDLLALLDGPKSPEDYLECKPWSDKNRLEREKETLGFYLTGHPVKGYLKEFKGFISPIIKLSPVSARKAIVCGLVNSVRKILTKRGKKLVIIKLEDSTDSLDVVVFSERFEEQEHNLHTGNILFIDGEVSKDDFSGGIKMSASAIYCVEEARARFSKCLVLKLNPDDQTLLPILQSVLQQHKGDCVVQIQYANSDAQASFNLGENWRVTLSDELLQKLIDVLDINRVYVDY